MKQMMIEISLVLLVIAAATLLPGRAQEAATTGTAASQQAPTHNWAAGNPLKIALLKWYQANTTTTFKVGNQPYGVAFDGANIWTANYGDGTVTKLRANDGEILGTFPGGGFGITFDGANIWTTGGNAVTKLRASDGKNLGTFTVSADAVAGWPAFDGENVWVTGAFSEGNGIVVKLRASDGKLLGTFPVGPYPFGAACEGSHIWVANGVAGNQNGSVTKLRASDGKVLGTFPVGHGPQGMAFDGANLWVANRDDNSVSKLRASDGKVVGTFIISRTIGPYGLAFDGDGIWVTGLPYVVKLRASDGRELSRLRDGGGAGVAFDGANIWVGEFNDNAVGKF